MKKSPVLVLAAFCSLAVLADPFGDRPNATHAWAVHDEHRANPAKITADAGKVPSDAKVLFDGTEASIQANWTDTKGQSTKWTVADGDLISVRGAGYIQTKESFGDCQLHVEWASPVKVESFGQGRGNSGVFLMSKYEVQVLDSYETDPNANPNKNPNYADGQAGAVYGQNPPLANPARAPGVFQTYDIVFHQPVWEGDTLVHPGTMTVFFNGVLVQDDWPLEGPTMWRQRAKAEKHALRLPFQLQDHGNPVHYRNIWIREIPSRYANVTHGGYCVDKAAVLKLRAETAQKVLAAIKPDAPLAQRLTGTLEAFSYDPSVKPQADKLAAEYLKVIAASDAAALKKNAGELRGVNDYCQMLVRNQCLAKDDPLVVAVAKAVATVKDSKKN